MPLSTVLLPFSDLLVQPVATGTLSATLEISDGDSGVSGVRIYLLGNH